MPWSNGHSNRFISPFCKQKVGKFIKITYIYIWEYQILFIMKKKKLSKFYKQVSRNILHVKLYKFYYLSKLNPIYKLCWKY